MNKIVLNKKLLGSLMLALLLTACKSAPMVEKPAAVEDRNAANQSAPKLPTNGVDTSAIKEVVIKSNDTNSTSALKDPSNILSKRNIYFDFDSDAVKAEFRPVIEAHAKYLLAHADAKVSLQGNADERGTREYNLALGQRRSVSVKKSLNLLGVQDKQIETVSYGKEKATVGCTNDACYKLNRRVDIVYEND